MGATRHNNQARKSTAVARTDILAIAIRMFAQRGYHEATVRLLADEIGVRPASIYYHFRDKQAILSSIISDATDRLLAELAALEEGLDPRANAELLMSTHLRFVYAHRDETRIILEQSHLLDGKMVEEVLQRQRAVLDIYREHIAALFAASSNPGRDNAVASLLALSVVTGFPRWAQVGPGRSLDHQIARAVDFILGGLGSP